MRKALIALGMLVCSLGTPAFAQLSISFGSPGVSIGINLPVYPTLRRIPNYPVYYSTAVNSNYFFYDGLYWVFEDDDWYASDWYNGPWYRVDRFDVPLFILRVPVRYYRHAPDYFRGWRADAPPRWGEHWGGAWEERRSGWDRWSRSSAPAPAPLPTYQRQYSGERYPQAVQQATIQTRNYRYQPRDTVARQYYEQRRSQVQSVAPQQPTAPQPRQQPAPRQQVAPAPRQQVAPQQQAAPREQVAPAQRQQVAPQQQAAPRQQVAPAQRQQVAPQQQATPRQQAAPPQQAPASRPQAPGAQGQERAAEAKGQAKGQDKGQTKVQDKEKDKDKDKDQGKGKGGPKDKD